MSSIKIIALVFILALGLNGAGQIHGYPDIPADTTFTMLSVTTKNKKYFPEAIPVKESLPEGVKAYRDVVYATLKDTPYGDRNLRVDVFTPEKEGLYPALIMVHGGGWRAGNKSLQVPMAEQIAASGYVTVTVEYQLSMEAKYPAAVYNIKAAIRWMRANADTYNIDTTKIAISGCSAGGQLAMLVGMTNGVEKFEGDMGYANHSSEVQAILDLDGVVNFMAPNSLNLGRSKNSPDVEWLEGDFYTRPDRWKDASSIYWANENSVPVLFLNSGFPRFHAGQDELIGMMKNWNIYTEVHKFDVKMHTFWLFHPWVDSTITYMVDFMDKTLK